VTRNILFVDDEIPLRETLSLYFRRKGYGVTTAGNSEEALGFAKDGGFSAAILDVDLGGEDGLLLLDQFQVKYPNLPVIMFTSLEQEGELATNALSRGAKAWIFKGGTLDTLLAKVREVVG
jgi:DNA-binding response OmpR family regulator